MMMKNDNDENDHNESDDKVAITMKMVKILMMMKSK